MKQKQYFNKFNKDFKNGPHQKKNLKKKTVTKMVELNPIISIITLNVNGVNI